MTVETERLRLYPISDSEIAQLMETEADAEMKQAYSEMLELCRRHPRQRLWHTVWLMELKGQTGTIVGDFCFKGLRPDGMVELGYGLWEGFCGKGYMTEAVRAIAGWALSQPDVTRVEAETEPQNLASQKVLAASGFVPLGICGTEGPRFVLNPCCNPGIPLV